MKQQYKVVYYILLVKFMVKKVDFLADTGVSNSFAPRELMQAL